jgi:hypothetical protein
MDEEVAESPAPPAPLVEMRGFTYNGDTLIDKGAASDHGGGDPYF